MQVLIGHASAHDSTKGIARRIADVLEHESPAADVRLVSRVGGLDADAIQTSGEP